MLARWHSGVMSKYVSAYVYNPSQVFLSGSGYFIIYFSYVNLEKHFSQ